MKTGKTAQPVRSPEAGKTHYRVLRSTIVLATYSKAYADIRTPALAEAVAEVQQRNYAFDVLDRKTLETVFAAFDDDFTRRVRSEFHFDGKATSVRIHPEALAICELCGKGDSKDTGDNRDHLRFEFRLHNTAGGREAWCGATCIVNYGLKVQGAATAEEADRILSQALRQALRAYNIAQWQGQNGDHADMQEQYERLRRSTGEAIQAQRSIESLLLGYDERKLRDVRGIVRRFRASLGFYLRSGYLTKAKEPAWEDAKYVLSTLKDYAELQQQLSQIVDRDAAFEKFMEIRRERAEEKSNVEAA